MLDVVSGWCRKWRLRINSLNSKVIHFGKRQQKRRDHVFCIGGECLDYTTSYKYLGVLFDEFATFKNNTENLAKSGGRALGGLISKIHSNKSIGFYTYEKMFLSGLCQFLTTAVECGGTQNITTSNPYSYGRCDTF